MRHLFGDAAGQRRFASYYLSLHQDAAKTALELGYSETRTLFANYRKLIDPEDAVEYWRIFPPAGGAIVVPFAA